MASSLVPADGEVGHYQLGAEGLACHVPVLQDGVVSSRVFRLWAMLLTTALFPMNPPKLYPKAMCSMGGRSTVPS